MKKAIFLSLKRYAKEMKLWIGEVKYSIGVYMRENVFWRLKCFMKYSRVRRYLANSRKQKYFMVTK